MQAVVFADRHGAELAPLCDNLCPALLSLANLPVLQYTIEDLARAGVTEILLVVSDDAARVESVFGDGAMWGVCIRYLLSRGEESPTRLLARFGSLLRTPFVAARGDVFRSAACSELLGVANDQPGPVVSAALDGSPIGLGLVREWPTALPDLDWPMRSKHCADQAPVHLKQALFSPLDHLASFHRAVLELAVPTQSALGRPGAELAPGLRVGRLSKVDPGSLASGSLAVGEQSWVHKTAHINGPCVIGSDCYIDRDVRIDNSVVMPGSYIGENLEVTNAIVAGSTLIRVDLGAQIVVDENQLLSNNDSEFAGRFRQWPARMIGAALLLLTLPLWPLALLASSIPSARAPLSSREILSNRRQAGHGSRRRPTIKAWLFSTRSPLLRHLPMLWLVARGDLQFFGTRPIPPAPGDRDTQTRGWLDGSATGGLLGPAQLFLSADAPEEQIRLCELEFVADRGLPALRRRLGAAASLLFHPRAWWPAHDTLGGS